MRSFIYMFAYVFSAALPWLALFAALWWYEFKDEGYWAQSVWSLPRMEYFDVPWLAMLLVGLPVALAWSGAELIRFWRQPRLFDRPGLCTAIKLLLLGLLTGTCGVALFAAATAYQAETRLPDVANVVLAMTLPSLAIGLLPGRSRSGCCAECNYDTRHLPFPATPRLRRCPECGSEVA